MYLTPFPPNLIPILLAAFGACLGSFVNVVALRFITHEDIVKKRSYCPHCHRRLTWFELIPIISYILLRGRCRLCHEPISLQYPVIEALTAISAIIIFSPLPVSLAGLIPPLLSLAAVCLLLILAVIDSRTMVLPDVFIILLAGLVALQLVVTKQLNLAHLVGAAVGAGFLLILWVVTRRQGIGLGDIKLGVPLGLLVGWPAVVALLLLAFVAGGVWGLYLLAFTGATRKTAVPFGPYLSAAAMASIWWPHLPSIILSLLGWPSM